MESAILGMKIMSELYPPIHENRHFKLKVDDIHEIYVEECGNENGMPVVFLHGGPGSGCMPYQRQQFDPEKYRIILFDQRGCGRSSPHASLENNTVEDLISDIEVIRKEMGVDKWVVAGGSWGSTLSLAYAEAYPNRVLGLIVRGIFLCTNQEIHWLYQYGASLVYPDYWQDFLSPIPDDEQDNILKAYYKRLTGSNEIVRMEAAKSWSLWESRIATVLPPSKSALEHSSEAKNTLSIARIEAHYFMNNAFFEDDRLLNDIAKIEGIPGYIVQGRYDMICPMKQAWELNNTWQSSELIVVQGAGHSGAEHGISAALYKAGNDMLKQLGAYS